MKAQKTIALVICLTILLALVACGAEQPQAPPASPTQVPETTFERVKREGVIRVGFANENPFAYAQPDGKLTGEGVEVARVIFQRLGIPEMEGVLAEFGALIPGLQAGRFDAITAGMYIKPERCEQALIAAPDYKVGGGLIVLKGNPLNLHSYEDIAANPDVKVGTGAGYFEEQYMKAVGVKEEQIVLFPDNPSGVAGMQAGQIDAFTATAIGLAQTLGVTEDPNLELALPFTDPVIDGKPITGYSGTAFRMEDLDLRLSLIHISEPTRLLSISYAVFCLKKKKTHPQPTIR